MRALLVTLLTVSVLLSIAFHGVRWRLPQQPRLAVARERTKRHSARTELAIELGIITAACLVLPVVAIGLTVLLIAVAAHVG